MPARQPPSPLWKSIVWPALALVVAGQLWLRAVPGVSLLLKGGHSTTWLVLWVSALCSSAILLWRLFLVARYKPAPGVENGRLPMLTVIVPAYNEGRQVFETLRSLAASDYPREKLQIISVDDGSVDDTWHWIKKGAEQFGRLVTPVHCPVNRGKRVVLYEGFLRARGSVIVTVDSDSEVLPDTLRNLVTPLVLDPRVGAVAGNVRVLNDTGTYGYMLDVAFTYAFEFLRVSESMVDTVTCCPGALSAFRRDVVDQVKEEWLAQTFLGEPAKIGEDRAMTNLVLREGFLVKFQSNAVVLTEVPQRLPQLCRMLLRWARSNARESIYLGAFIFTRFRKSPALGARINFIWACWQMLLEAALFLPLVAFVTTQPGAVLCVSGGVLLSAFLPAAVFAASRGGLRSLWAFPYALFSTLVLSWIAPYALVTLRRSSWLTRAKPAMPEPARETAIAA